MSNFLLTIVFFIISFIISNLFFSSLYYQIISALFIVLLFGFSLLYIVLLSDFSAMFTVLSSALFVRTCPICAGRRPGGAGEVRGGPGQGRPGGAGEVIRRLQHGASNKYA